MQLVAPSTAQLGEAPFWSPGERALYWLDLLDPTLHRWSEERGHSARRLETPAPLGAIAPTGDPGVAVLTCAAGIALLDLRDGGTTLLLDPLQRLPHLHFNDAKVDRSGRLWLGTADTEEVDPRAVLFLLEGSRASVADAGFAVCNGPAFSPDGSVVYFSDSNSRTVLTYRMAEDGTLLDRRVFARFGSDEGYPDGLTVDADGFLWVAHWDGGRVSRFSPDGKPDRVLHVPAPNVTSVAFGGEDLGTLFITTARLGLDAEALESFPLSGGLFAEDRPGTRGLPEPAWRGPDDA
ncbi:SMP-30/gluconolactonase/LRE family protein [Lysobacter korlensis]|uniref:SMP-30/gluconolactonase/LRE family protein n=1 Tax=Lysobacter korlensis TaxID=553636 RepID=A0ABV6RP65_9GAMM